MQADFNRFTISLTKRQAFSASHPGRCDAEVAELVCLPSVKRQRAEIDPQAIRSELKEYGAWDEADLADDDQNWERIIWIAAGNIAEECGNHYTGRIR